MLAQSGRVPVLSAPDREREGRTVAPETIAELRGPRSRWWVVFNHEGKPVGQFLTLWMAIEYVAVRQLLRDDAYRPGHTVRPSR